MWHAPGVVVESVRNKEACVFPQVFFETSDLRSMCWSLLPAPVTGERALWLPFWMQTNGSPRLLRCQRQGIEAAHDRIEQRRKKAESNDVETHLDVFRQRCDRHQNLIRTKAQFSCAVAVVEKVDGWKAK